MLEKTSIIAGRLKPPTREIHREELRSRVETARRRVASFHFVRGDERQIVSQLVCRDRIDGALSRNGSGSLFRLVDCALRVSCGKRGDEQTRQHEGGKKSSHHFSSKIVLCTLCFVLSAGKRTKHKERRTRLRVLYRLHQTRQCVLRIAVEHAGHRFEKQRVLETREALALTALQNHY